VTDFAFGEDYAVGMALTPDGKIVVVGQHYAENNPTEIALARYNPNGTLDTTFDGDGRSLQRITFNGSRPAGVAVQADGRSSSRPPPTPPPAAGRTSASSATHLRPPRHELQ
jgi:hypothetical protein